MDLIRFRPIIRHWYWLYRLLDYNEECENLKEEEKFIEQLKDDFGYDKESWLLNIIRSKKLISINDYGQRIKIVPEHFIYIISSEIDEVMKTVKGRGIKKTKER